MNAIDADEYRSCPTHCCRDHGCKYGLAGCPVKTGKIVQEYRCEHCAYVLEDVQGYPGSIYDGNPLGTRLVVGYKREDGTLTGFPTEEEVTAAIRSALENFEVAPGWFINFVGE